MPNNISHKGILRIELPDIETSLNTMFNTFTKLPEEFINEGILLEQVFPTLKHMIQQDIKYNFEVQSYNNNPWEKLKPKYEKEKLFQHYGTDPGILIDTKELKKQSTDIDFIETKNSLEINTRDLPNYWKYHHTGTIKMPQRRFIGLSQETILKTRQLLVKVFNEFAGQRVQRLYRTGFEE